MAKATRKGPDDALRVVSWNVNGLRAAHGKGFLDWLEGCGADLVFIQETKALPEQLPDELRAPDGWFSAFHSAKRKGYSGVALYARREPDEVVCGMGVERFDDEGRVIMARYGKLALYGCYFPNGGDDRARVPFKLDFYRDMLDLMNRQREAGLEVVVGGDYNTAHHEIDLARPKENEKNTGFLPQERAWVDRYVADGWDDSFRLRHPTRAKAYSWWSYRGGARERNVGWRIDYHFVDEALKARVLDADIEMATPGSDHAPVTLTLSI